MTTVKTTNECYGFYGTMTCGGVNADDAWNIAIAKIAELTGHEHEHVGAWLDTKDGRHVADSVRDRLRNTDLTSAIDAAVNEWNGFRQTREHRRNGAPACATYLQAQIALIAFNLAS